MQNESSLMAQPSPVSLPFLAHRVFPFSWQPVTFAPCEELGNWQIHKDVYSQIQTFGTQMGIQHQDCLCPTKGHSPPASFEKDNPDLTGRA